MKSLILLITTAVLFATTTQADTYVKGYTRSNGTYVQPHYRSDSNYTTSDNWSTKGNVNPYTGRAGTRNAYDTNNGYGNSYNPNYYDNSGSSENSWDD